MPLYLRSRLLLLTAVVTLTFACSGPDVRPDETPKTDDASEESKTPAADEAPDGPVLPTVDIPHETFVLDNGLTVVVHEDHKTPVVAVNVWYHVGSKDEKPGKTGFAHLFEHLMFQGSENFQGEFFEPLEDAGATDMNGTTNEDRTNYFETVPTSALDLALWMESDRMGHFAGAISQERLDEQRGVVQNEKRQGRNRPYGKAWELIPENTFPTGHPYSWPVIGSMEDLEAASLEDVKTWFGTYYGASNAVLVLSGDITVEEAREKVERYFGHIAAGPAVPKRGTWIAKMEETRELTTFDQVPQERAYFVYNVPPFGEDVTEHLRLATRILGSGKNSRFHKRLVYEDQLATRASVWFGDGEIASQIFIIADARPGVPLTKVERALEEEIARLVEEGPTPEELGRVKMSYFADRVSALEKVGGFRGKANLLAKHQVFLGDAGAYARRLETLRETTPADIQSASRTWLDDGRFVLRVLPDPEYAAASGDAEASRDKLPDVGEAPDLDLPELQRATLSNGVKVVLAERHDVPVVRISALFDRGFAGEREEKRGVARLAMDVIDEGTAERGSLELAAALERLGAGLASGASLDHAYVRINTLSTTLPASLDLFAEVVRQPAFDDEEIERRRKQLLAAIEQEEARPFSTALRLLGPLLYGESHPYGVPLTGSGTTESVEGLSRNDLVGFHERSAQPDRTTLLVVGDTTLEEIRPALEKRFGDWKPSGADASAWTGGVPKADGARVFLIDKPDAEQSLILAGNVFPKREDVDQIAVETMNAVIGGTFTSRINMNLREEKHWSYGARSFVYETQREQLFGAYANVQSDKTSESMAEMQRELEEFLTTRPVTEKELARIKENKTRKLPGQNETTARLLGSVTEIVKFDLPDDYYDTYTGRVRSLTERDVREAADRVIEPEKMTWIVVGDLERIEAKVRALGFGDVTILDGSGPQAK